MHHRYRENAAITDGRSSRKGVLRILTDVWHVDDVACQDRTSAQGSPARWSRISLFQRSEPLGIDVVLRCKVQELSIETNDQAIDRVAQPRRICSDGIEHRLDVGWRATEDPQNLARRRLLIKRLGHLRVCLREGRVLVLQLGEQPDVLDGDDGLVGEDLKELDLLVREWIYLGAPKPYRAHRHPLPQQRNGQQRAEAQLPSEGAAFRKLLRLGLEISYMNNPPLDHGAPRDGPAHDRNKAASGNGDWTVVGG